LVENTPSRATRHLDKAFGLCRPAVRRRWVRNWTAPIKILCSAPGHPRRSQFLTLVQALPERPHASMPDVASQ